VIGPEDRLIALCDQSTMRVTGIDFIQIVDPHVQTLLRVFFVIDPDTLVNPLAATLPSPFPPEKIEIRSTTGDVPVLVSAAGATWRGFTTPAGARTVLEIEVAEPGGFSHYRLTIHDEPRDRVDRFFNGVVFSFKQGCPSVFDCRQTRDCPPEQPVDWPVDYLARDFESLRNSLLDFAAQRYPLWRERVPADAAAMIMELAAAVGDEFAYIQDRIAREGTLPTLAERRSLWWHTQLVDYTIDEGASATTWLDIQILPGQQGPVSAGARAWAAPEGESPIPFELGSGLADQRAGMTFWLSDAWNSMPVYVPDGHQSCLLARATQLYLVGQFPQPSQLPQPPMADPTRFWIGRPMLIRTDPADPAEPSQRFLVHITEVENTTDPLLLVGGNPLAITRIAWRSSEALPFDLCLPETSVHGNLVLSTAGETFTEFFAIADNGNAPAALRDQVATAVERQGPLNAETRTRPPIFLHSLAQTEQRGLGRLGGAPEVELQEVVPSGTQLVPIVPPRYWQWNPTPIDAATEDLAYTLDFGAWRKVITFDRPGGRILHLDRASDNGATIRFGDGDYGTIPSDGSLFRVRYRTDVGARGNVAADSVTVLHNLDPASNWPTLVGIAASVTNPFAVTNGRDPEDIDIVKQVAPEAYKANPRRAARDEDYRAIAEQETWVKRAGATRRWTGSWLTEFVTADPEGATVLSAENRAQLEQGMDCVRQAGRPVVVRDPIYRPIDLRIRICIDPDAYDGQVIERVTEALAGPRRFGKGVPFFDLDNFTFGQPFYRAALEAAIQAVPGVLAVEHIRIRVRGLFDWRPFPGFVFRPGDDRILRLDNDPSRPEAGSLIVTTRDAP
jgi:hypothetical protein